MQRDRSLNVSLGQVTGPYRHLNQFDLNPEGNRELLEGFTWESGRKSLWFEDDDSGFPTGNDQAFHNGVGDGRVPSAVTVAVGKDMGVILQKRPSFYFCRKGFMLSGLHSWVESSPG